MTNPVTLPAGTSVGKSYEKGVDINLGTTASPSWQNIRRLFGFNHTPTPVTNDAQTYDDLGSPNADVTGWGWSAVFTTHVNRLASGLYLPEIEALFALTKPSAIGELAVGEFRWYDKPATATPNPNDAGQGLATVAPSRVNTAPDGSIESVQWTITGKGAYTEITNPWGGWDASTPTVTAVVAADGSEPAGTGELVLITGTNLLGATAVEIDSIAMTEYTVISSTTIVAILPTDDAGAVDVVVTTPGGTSAAFEYTRGA